MTINQILDELARRYDAGEFRGKGEYSNAIARAIRDNPEAHKHCLCGTIAHSVYLDHLREEMKNPEPIDGAPAAAIERQIDNLDCDHDRWHNEGGGGNS